MDYINLGKTGLKVSRICLGVMSYGSKTWREWVLEEEESRPFLRRALDLGINFFDSADVYSLGESERILGNALKDFGVDRECVVIASKVHGKMGPDPNQQGLSIGWIAFMLIANSAAFEYSAVFHNAMLPSIAPRARVGFLSGLGLAAPDAGGSP